MMKKPYFSLSNITTGILIVFSLLMVFNPDAKAFVLKGLMKIGFFQPDVDTLKKDVAQAPPDASFRDTAGNAVSLSGLKGKVVFLNFWATWCPPCRAEMPALADLYKSLKHNKNVVFLMVDVDSNYKKAKAYLDAEKLILPVVEPDGNIPESLFGGSLPTTLIFDKRGQLVFKHEGAADFSGKKVYDYLSRLSKE